MYTVHDHIHDTFGHVHVYTCMSFCVQNSVVVDTHTG